MFRCKKCNIKCHYDHGTMLCSFCGKRSEYHKKNGWFGSLDLTKTSRGAGSPRRTYSSNGWGNWSFYFPQFLPNSLFNELTDRIAIFSSFFDFSPHLI